MTLRLKTIEFAFPTDVTSYAALARTDFDAITLYIPETTSRTFRSVVVQITMVVPSLGGTLFTSRIIGIKLGAVAFNDVTVIKAGNNSNIHNTFMWERDVTSYFVTNFGAEASQTCQVGFVMGSTTIQRINTTAKLIITYEYDDVATTRVKTVRIPLESQLGSLTTTLAEIGTNQVPALDTFLPEAVKVYRNIFFEVTSNTSPYADPITDFRLALALDSEAETLDGSHSGVDLHWYTFIWVRNDIATNVVHAFKMRSTVMGRFHHPSIVLCVTYEYDHAASTRIMNHVMLPIININRMGRPLASDRDRDCMKFNIEEPGTIALVQSGIHLTYWPKQPGLAEPTVACGSQAIQTYSQSYVSGNNYSHGNFDLIHRVDAAARKGVGIILAHGINVFTLDLYTDTSFEIGGTSALLFLNYTSDKSAMGDGAHNHTVVWEIIAQYNDTSNYNDYRTGILAPTIPEFEYWITGLAVETRTVSPTNPNIPVAHSFKMECLPSENVGDGWKVALTEHTFSSTSSAYILGVSRDSISTLFKRHPLDLDTDRLVLTAARRWRFISGAGTTGQVVSCLRLLITYHAITFTVAGTVTGFTGDGSGITVNLCRADTGERMATAITDVGGTYSIPWYDNTIPMFVEARQDGTHLGRSNNGVAA